MEELKTDELKDIAGGFEISIGLMAAIAFGTPFAIGFLDGLIRPLKCN